MKTTHRSLLAAFAASVLLVAAAFAQTDLEKATAALKAGAVATAESLVTPLTTAASPDAAALNLLSQVRSAQRRFKDAVDAAEQATKLAPTQPDYFTQLGIALSQRMGEVNFIQMAMMSGKMKGAFEKAVALDANHVGGLIGLTRYYTNAPEIAGGSTTKAREFAQRVAALHPFLGASELGRIAEREEKLAEALQHYEAAVAARPEAAAAHFAAGNVLVKLGRKDEARARFETVLKLAPQHGAAQKALAEL